MEIACGVTQINKVNKCLVYGSLFYFFNENTAIKTMSLILNVEIKLLLIKAMLLDRLALVWSRDPPPPHA